MMPQSVNFKTRPLCELCQKIVTGYDSAVRVMNGESIAKWYHLPCWDLPAAKASKKAAK